MKLCVISYHTSPLASPGAGTSGGMNVFIARLYEKLLPFARIDIFIRGSHRIVHHKDRMRIIQIPHHDLNTFADHILHYHEQISYDLIHSHYWLSGLIARTLRRHVAVPWIHSFHTIEHLKKITADPDRIEAEHDLMRSCDFIISPTFHEQVELHKIHPMARIIVIPHGVDTRTFTPSPNGHKRLLFVGRITRIKGLNVLIDALRFLEHDTQLTVVGGPAQDKQTYEGIKTYSRGLPVHFAGTVPHETLSACYRSASIVIIPSFYESFGLVALEAMSSARPVIAFNDTGLKEIIGNNAGVLIRRNERTLARTIKRMLQDENIVIDLGEKGRMKAMHFDWSYISLRYRMTYEKIIKN
jgi:D-inositol-3-phosphate glycosyltransferase